MKTSYTLYFVLAVFLSACGQQRGNDQFDEFNYGSNENNVDFNNQGGLDGNNQQKRNSNKRDIKYHTIMDPQFGIPVGAMPIPTAWRESNNTKENLLLEGPNGLKIYKAMSNYSQLNAPIKSIDRFIHEDIKQLASAEGYRFVKQYPLAQMVQFDKRFDSYLFQATPVQKHYQCIATEWENQEGILSLIIVRYYVAQYQIGGSGWGVTVNCLEAPKNSFETNKKAFINGLLNFQINPQWVQANNQYWSQKAQLSAAGHKQRMAAIESFGKNNTAAHNSRMASSDAQYNNWRNEQLSSDARQSNYVNGIWERKNMTDPNTGQQYQVDGYDNTVWMNQDNEYIGTDNTLYNPNIDNNVNNQNWIELDNNNNN